MPLNFEFKARCSDPDSLEEKLLTLQPRFAGEDLQTDTYFVVPNGRLKLREGPIENALIHYNRADEADAKTSEVQLFSTSPGSNLKELLTAALGVKVVVQKRRRIYFVDNVKFHFDRVDGLGTFVEVEAIDRDGSIGLEKLQEQCFYYRGFLGVNAEDCLSGSYSDMLLAKKYSTPAGEGQATDLAK